MAVIQFRDQFAKQIGEIVAMIHERHERGVFVAHGLPIDAVHVRRVEEVTHLAPAFVVHLCPLRAPVELHVEACGL